MILGYKIAPGEEPYFFGKVDGIDKKFRRVIAGIMLPVFDRQEGAAVLVAERFQISRPQDFTVLECAIGEWPQVEQALKEWDRDYLFKDAVVPSKEERKLLWRSGLSLSILTSEAPKWALTDVGRQKVNQLIHEGRLHFSGNSENMMAKDADITSKAHHLAVCYALDWNPPYLIKKPRPIEARPAGAVGL